MMDTSREWVGRKKRYANKTKSELQTEKFRTGKEILAYRKLLRDLNEDLQVKVRDIIFIKSLIKDIRDDVK